MEFIDICAGIGGFRLGFEQAVHKCVGFIERDKFAVASYRAMHNTEGEFYHDDITTIKSGDIPYADAWCFGFPCQDISVAGKQAGLDGSRSGIYFDIINLVKGKKEEDKPRWLIIENVKNLLSIDNGWGFARVLAELDEAGYDAEWQLLNSKNFGVPQNRERVFIVGHLRGRGGCDVFPISGFTTGTINGFQADTSGKGYSSQNDRVNLETGIACCLAKSRAITKNKIMLKSGEVRVLSAKERMRCQGFDDAVSDKAIKAVGGKTVCGLAGNAVTVTVAKAIGERLKGVEID